MLRRRRGGPWPRPFGSRTALKQSSWQEALVEELLSYVFSPLREGDIALYRGSGNGLPPILLAAAEETSVGCAERLEHEYGLKTEIYAARAARALALGRTHSVCWPAHWRYRISCASRSLSRGRSAMCMSEALFIRTSSRQISWWTRQAAACG